MSDDAGPALLTADERTLAFAEKVIELLDRTNKTATYKFAVLLGLIDVCQEMFTKDGFAPTSITTAQLAQAVIGLYWNQVRPFARNAGDVVLRQITSTKGKAIPDYIREARTRAAEAPFGRFRDERRDDYRVLRRQVEWTLVRMPLPKLQKIGGREERFIYEIAWDDDRPVSESVFADPARFQNLIQFIDGAGDHLVRLSSLLRPVIRRRWALMVSNLNRLDSPEAGLDSALERHLFGAPREVTRPIRDELRKLQGGRCFYCSGPLQHLEVDHFVPWARVPLDAIENLVAADRRCNNDKRDSLPAAHHVERWARRLHEQREQLAKLASDAAWESSWDRTRGLARSIYLPITPDALLWSSIATFVAPDKPLLFRALE